MDDDIGFMNDLDDISKTELARIILRLVWQSFDRGGISMGRSPKSRILEAVMGIIPLPELDNLDDFHQDEIKDAVEFKTGYPGLQQFQLILLPEQFEFWGDHLLAYVLLCELIFLSQEMFEKHDIWPIEENYIKLAIELLIPEEDISEAVFFLCELEREKLTSNYRTSSLLLSLIVEAEERYNRRSEERRALWPLL